MYYNQYEHYKAKGGRREEQLEQYSNPSISIKELRLLTDTVNSINNLQDLTMIYLKDHWKKLMHIHIFVTYDKIKKGGQSITYSSI
jgi:plasmid replication initiation protein